MAGAADVGMYLGKGLLYVFRPLPDETAIHWVRRTWVLLVIVLLCVYAGWHYVYAAEHFITEETARTIVATAQNEVKEQITGVKNDIADLKSQVGSLADGQRRQFQSTMAVNITEARKQMCTAEQLGDTSAFTAWQKNWNNLRAQYKSQFDEEWIVRDCDIYVMRRR